MKDVTTSQIYQKGSWTLHMLRGVVGTKVFWEGIRTYYRRYRNSNATVSDFRRVMEEVSGNDLTYFFDQWLYKPGTLKYKGNWRFDKNNKKIIVNLDQIQTDGSFYKMPIEIAVYYLNQGQPQMQIIQADAKTNVFSIDVNGEPEKVILDPEMWILMDADFKRAE
jgi:aminopeptidase N